MDPTKVKNSGKFVKGHKPWNTGVKATPEQLQNLSQKGKPAWNKGIAWDEETKLKMSETQKRASHGINSGSFKPGVKPWNTGKKVPQMAGEKHPNFGKRFSLTDEQKSYVRERNYQVENHPNWIADRTKLVKSERHHLDGQYRDWMLAVKKRDGWKCKINNSECQGRLEAHHILSWKLYPRLRFESNNGITLCHAHHPKGRTKEAELAPFFQSLVTQMQ